MLHYYLQKGIVPGDILSLPPVEQLFFAASMKLAVEEYNERLKEMNGRMS